MSILTKHQYIYIYIYTSYINYFLYYKKNIRQIFNILLIFLMSHTNSFSKHIKQQTIASLDDPLQHNDIF